MRLGDSNLFLFVSLIVVVLDQLLHFLLLLLLLETCIAKLYVFEQTGLHL